MEGKIVIEDNKVYFEPKGLEKPDPLDYDGYGIIIYQQKLKAYEASKQLVEVDNISNIRAVGIYILKIKNTDIKVENNQPCKAEIENNKATIIELINRK